MNVNCPECEGGLLATRQDRAATTTKKAAREAFGISQSEFNN